MDAEMDKTTLVERARWLIKLRWAAAGSVALATFFCGDVVGISLQETALYGIAAVLVLYNAVMLGLLNHFAHRAQNGANKVVDRVIRLQMSADLLILTILLHYSGGIENPFVSFFFFHMIIASILLSVWESYLQATFAVVLLGLLILLEYSGAIGHYCLEGYVGHCSYRDGAYILGAFPVFVVTLYLVVYMASYIAVRLRQAERAQRTANASLREKDCIKDEYVARLTHDIKGHLAAIQTCLDVAVDGPLDNQAAEFVHRARERTRKVTAFVRALLRLTRMRLNGKTEMGTFDLREVVQDVVDAVGPKARSKSIVLDARVAPDVGDVFGTRLSIEELLTNLLLNAIKYTPEHGQVSLTVAKQGSCVMLRVADTGIGIPQAEQPKIFDEFYRATNARQLEKDGTGLGLSIVKQIVQMHGGNITVESEESRGTTFTVTFPNAAATRVVEIAGRAGAAGRLPTWEAQWPRVSE